jgi:hypothetical protein
MYICIYVFYMLFALLICITYFLIWIQMFQAVSDCFKKSRRFSSCQLRASVFLLAVLVVARRRHQPVQPVWGEISLLRGRSINTIQMWAKGLRVVRAWYRMAELLSWCYTSLRVLVARATSFTGISPADALLQRKEAIPVPRTEGTSQ